MDPDTDIKALVDTRGGRRQPAEQIVYSCYVSICFYKRMLWLIKMCIKVCV